jgi:hypothetical protein
MDLKPISLDAYRAYVTDSIEPEAVQLPDLPLEAYEHPNVVPLRKRALLFGEFGPPYVNDAA